MTGQYLFLVYLNNLCCTAKLKIPYSKMKLLVAVCVLAFVGLALADTKTYSRGCIYINGRCYKECDVGTHAYTTGCGYLTPEATCDNPVPVEDRSGHICDYSSCYCDSPTVRDTVSNKCVKLEDCPKKD